MKYDLKSAKVLGFKFDKIQIVGLSLQISRLWQELMTSSTS